MFYATRLRGLALAVLTGAAVAVLAVAAPLAIGGATPAEAQIAAEFQAALNPHGAFRRHARWGVVWAPAQRPRGWQPYTHGHWVFTEEWGWYWISDREEEDWGWVTYHYGRWAFDRGMGWIWIRGDDWGPAWVNWRRGDDVVGWAPLPPDALIDDYEDEPALWNFVQPRFLIDPRVRTHVLPTSRARAVLRSTVVVNRTMAAERGSIAINPGIAPAILGAAARTSIPSYRVAPRVVGTTRGVTGAVAVRPQDLSRRVARGASRFGLTVQRTAAIKPAASVPKPEPFGKNERGRADAPRPQAAQPAPVAAPTLPKAAAVAPVRAAPRPAVEPQVKPQQVKPVAAPVILPPQGHPDEPPPQAKPVRPIAPQTPPPPPPQAGVQTRPVRSVAAAPRQVMAPKPVVAQKPQDEKKPRKPGERPDRN